MNLKEGKNYKLINHLGIHYDLIYPSLGEQYTMRIYGKFDLLVDGEITKSPSDFWIITHDLDGTTFAQPIDGYMLAEKLMTLTFVPLKQPKSESVKDVHELVKAMQKIRFICDRAKSCYMEEGDIDEILEVAKKYA